MKKVGLLLLVLVLALGATGVGFAKWSQTLTIDGIVETGELTVGIRDVAVFDQGPDPAAPPGHNEEGKDVAVHESINGEYKCTHTTWGDFYHGVIETIYNAYPYYKSGTVIEFANCGTIPAKIDTVTMQVIDGNPVILDYLEVAEWEVYLNDGSIGMGVGKADLEAFLANFQLHPCEKLTLVVMFYFIEEIETELLPQMDYVVFQWMITWSQWNEVP
jgi:hypothetical protein